MLYVWCWACVYNTMPVPPLWAEVTPNPPNLIIFILKVYHRFGVCGSVGQYTSVKSNNPIGLSQPPRKMWKVYSLHIPSLFPLVKCPKSDFCLSVYNLKVSMSPLHTACRLLFQIVHDSFCAQLYVPVPINLIECMEGLFNWHPFMISISEDEDTFKNTAK